MSTSPATKARWAQLTTLCLLALLMLVLVVETVLLVPARIQLLVIALKLLPLLFFVWPIWQGRPMSAVWLGFLLMLYFCWAVLGLYESGLAGQMALARTLLIGSCFTSAMLFTRWRRAVLEA